MKPNIIHVNKQHIAMNAKDGGNRPVFTTKTNKGETIYSRGIKINGPCEFVSNKNQLKCGARVWVETYADLTFIDKMSFKEARAAK